MPTDEFLSRSVNHLGNLAKLLGDLQGPQAVVSELIQNADDAPGATVMSFSVDADALTLWNDGEFSKCDDVTSDECALIERQGHRCDFHSFRSIASGDKREREGTTGAFGVGFTAVYQLTDRPELWSAGEHWVLDESRPESERIRRTPGVTTEGTTFRLPWAKTSSALREQLRQSVIDDEYVDALGSVLHGLVPAAMPFLHKLKRVEVRTPLSAVTYERSSSGREVGVTGSNGSSRTWVVFEGSMGDAGRNLKRRYPELVSAARPEEVRIAFETTPRARGGHFHATLPTEQSTELPFSVDGSFFPMSDRKRIRLDTAAEGQWNQAVLDAAAELLVAVLEDLPALVGHETVVRTLLDAQNLHRLEGGVGTPGRWWDRLVPALPTARIVPTSTGGIGTPEGVRLWSDEEVELAADGVLGPLGIELVHPSVRAGWFLLRATDVGIKVLVLGDLVSVLLDRETALSIDDDSWALLWRLMEHQLSMSNLFTEAATKDLKRCSVFPVLHGGLRSAADLHWAQDGTVSLLEDLGIEVPMLDLHKVQRHAPRLVGLVQEVTPAVFAAWIKTELAEGDTDRDVDFGPVIGWFENRRDHLGEVIRQRIAALPIFPSGAGRHSLTELSLPAVGFEDPLDLAKILDLKQVGKHRSFLEELGAEPLTLARYCTKFVPQAIGDGADEGHKQRLLELLTRHLSEIQDDDAVTRALGATALVPCTDGAWRRGGEVYFQQYERLLGSPRPMAEVPQGRSDAYRRLFNWLGVAVQPRAEDLVDHVRRLGWRPKDHAAVATALIEHLSGRFLDTDLERFAAQFGELRQRAWLPAEGKTQSFQPFQLHVAFSRNLFASQGQFLDVPLPAQRDATAFLRWLGLGFDPSVEQVISHLLHLRDTGGQPKSDIWGFLDRHADETAVGGLSGERCLPVSGDVFARPDAVFWADSPFGRHRWKLGEEFRQFARLLDRLGVRERPDPIDAVEVLVEIAVEHGGEDAPLNDEDLHVVYSCWALLDRGVREGQATPDDLEELRSTECVLDRRRVLREPSQVLFLDSAAVAELLPPDARARLIDRPEDIRIALEAVGVLSLRDVVTTSIVEREDRTGPSWLDRLVDERRVLLRRVLDAIHDRGREEFDRFESEVSLRALDTLRVVEEVDFAGGSYRTEGLERTALALPAEMELLVVEPPVRSWPEVARELLRCMGLTGIEPGDVAAVAAVLRAADPDEAARELDELGFARLAEAVDTETRESASARLGGEEDTGPDEVDGVQLSGDASADESGDESGDDSTTTAADEAGDDGADGQSSRPATDVGTAALEPTSVRPTPSEAGSGSSGTGTSSKDDEPTVSSSGPSRGGAPDGPRSDRKSAGPQRESRSERERLRSYVAPPTGGSYENDDDRLSAVAAVERAAVDHVLEYERSQGREPREMPPMNEGYDVESSAPDGEIRYIEVKGTAHQWDRQGIPISSRQFLEAQSREDGFWLYVVETADTSPRLHRIQDPATRIVQYFFDDEWRQFAEPESTLRTELQAISTSGSAEGLTRPVPVLDPTTGDLTDQWFDAPDVDIDDWSQTFAVQVAGGSLGMAYRGGVVIAASGGEVEADDLVVVRLADQVDPDTGLVVTVRTWAPVIGVDGRQQALRLTTDGSVAPLTVAKPEELEVLGIVTAQLRSAEVALD